MTQLQHTIRIRSIQHNCFYQLQPGKTNEIPVLGYMLSFSVLNDDTIIWPWYKQLR